MSSADSWKERNEEFILVVSGTTHCAPYLAIWQEFKDHLRKVVNEQPGWVDVYPIQGSRRGEMQGWCHLKNRKDADALYSANYESLKSVRQS